MRLISSLFLFGTLYCNLTIYYIDNLVFKYQHEDAKRTIIRLEQSADSYRHRRIASHGAFAMLYGRHLKHYIKKPEVFEYCNSLHDLHTTWHDLKISC